MKQLLLLLLLVITIPAYTQNYEVYAGSVISRDKDMHANYLLGVGYVFKSDQKREYLNNMYFGIEYQGMLSSDIKYHFNSNTNNINTDCNCDGTDLSLHNDSEFIMKKEIRGVGINFGVSTCKTCWLSNLYLMADITNYYYVTKIDNSKVSDKYQTQISGGFKYFVSINDWFLTPMVKYNPQAVSFGLGFSR